MAAEGLENILRAGAAMEATGLMSIKSLLDVFEAAGVPEILDEALAVDDMGACRGQGAGCSDMEDGCGMEWMAVAEAGCEGVGACVRVRVGSRWGVLRTAFRSPDQRICAT